MTDFGIGDILQQQLAQQPYERREAMDMASVAAYVQNGDDARRSRRRQEAQVDAYLQTKYEQCGKPNVYKPPEDKPENDMGTLINCKFVGDQAISQITEALQTVEQTQKVQPPPPPPKPESKWPWIAGMLGAGALAAGLTAYLTSGDDTDTQNTLRPANPGQIIDFSQ